MTALAERLAHGAASLGYDVLGLDDPIHRSGIVTIGRKDLDARMLVSRLKQAGIIAAPRQGYVRLSPHFYIAPEEIDRTLDLLGSGMDRMLRAVEGSAQSAVRVVIYEDLACQDCAGFRRVMDETLLPRFGSTAAFEHHDFPLAQHVWAGRRPSRQGTSMAWKPDWAWPGAGSAFELARHG